MNEIMVRRYMKDIMKRGVPKLMAKEIVEVAIDATSNGDIESAINYAMALTYGFKAINRAE